MCEILVHVLIVRSSNKGSGESAHLPSLLAHIRIGVVKDSETQSETSSQQAVSCV